MRFAQLRLARMNTWLIRASDRKRKGFDHEQLKLLTERPPLERHGDLSQEAARVAAGV